MLAAALPDFDRGLQTVKLALLLESEKQIYPQGLREYLISVVAETLSLLAEPSKIAAQARPESISLAIKVRANAELNAVFEEIGRSHQVTSENAALALKKLEATTDSVTQSAHPSFAVYATF